VGHLFRPHDKWAKEPKRCDITDAEDCPRRSPSQLTPEETRIAHELVTSDEYRHASTRALALLAQRTGRLYVSASTLCRLMRVRGWKRPRRRVHPRSPREGIRALRPNETWHIDTTLIRLVDGAKVYLHAVIDNFSRRILAWRVAANFEVASTLAVLHEAGASLGGAEVPSVLVDAGVENVNGSVDALIAQGLIRRVLAQVDVHFSNSMIEAWWRTLKHQWLFLHALTTLEQVERLVRFYVQQHNEVLPHAAFRGQTPDEMYFGKGAGVFEELEAKRVEARRKRLEANRAVSCAQCAGGG
jgi:transposase InsO family protein